MVPLKGVEKVVEEESKVQYAMVTTKATERECSIRSRVTVRILTKRDNGCCQP